MSDEVVSGWRVATYTGGQGNCVEVGRSATAVAVRDTKDREGGPVLRFDPSVWQAFTERLKGIARRGEHDPRSEEPRSPSGGLRMPADWPGITRLVCAGTPQISPGTPLVMRRDTHPLVSPGTLGTTPSCLSSWGLAGGKVFRWPL